MEAGWKGESAVMTEWWRRALWAMEAAASTNDRMYSYGTALLGVLARNTQAGSEEKALFDAVWRGSFTKMQDQEIEKLIGEYQAAGRRREKESHVGYLPEPEPESNRVGTVNRPPALGASGIEAGDLRSYSGADDPGHGPWVFRTMRREILAARLKVILDEQLNRDTSPLVQSLALMRLPKIVDSHAGGSDGAL